MRIRRTFAALLVVALLVVQSVALAADGFSGSHQRAGDDPAQLTCESDEVSIGQQIRFELAFPSDALESTCTWSLSDPERGVLRVFPNEKAALFWGMAEGTVTVSVQLESEVGSTTVEKQLSVTDDPYVRMFGSCGNFEDSTFFVASVGNLPDGVDVEFVDWKFSGSAYDEPQERSGVRKSESELQWGVEIQTPMSAGTMIVDLTVGLTNGTELLKTEEFNCKGAPYVIAERQVRDGPEPPEGAGYEFYNYFEYMPRLQDYLWLTAGVVGTELTIPEGAKDISNDAFMDCGLVKELTLPKNLPLTEEMLWYMPSLETVVFNGTMMDWMSGDGASATKHPDLSIVFHPNHGNVLYPESGLFLHDPTGQYYLMGMDVYPSHMRTAGQVLNAFANGTHYVHVGENSETRDYGELVCTGDVVHTHDEWAAGPMEITIVVHGDLCRTGENNMSQLVRMTDLIRANATTDSPETFAADWNGDGHITLADLIVQVSVFLGKEPSTSSIPLSEETVQKLVDDALIPLALNALRREQQGEQVGEEIALAEQDAHFWDEYLYALLETQNAAAIFGGDMVQFDTEYSLKEFYPDEDWSDTDRNRADLVDGRAVRRFAHTLFDIDLPNEGLFAPGPDKYVFWNWNPSAQVVSEEHEIPDSGRTLKATIAFSGDQFGGEIVQCEVTARFRPAPRSSYKVDILSYQVERLS